MSKIDLSSYAQQIIANPDKAESIISNAKTALNLYIDSIDKTEKATAFQELLAQIQQGVQELVDMTKYMQRHKSLPTNLR